MAFVFKSSKDLEKPIEKEYDIISSKRIHKIKKNVLKKNQSNKNKILDNFVVKPPLPRKKSAFGSNQKRDFLNLNLHQYSPGPGSYEIDSNFIKKSFNNNINLSYNNNKYKRFDVFDFEENNLNLFISKEERFRDYIKSENPGPGEYNLMKLPNIKKNISNKKFEIQKSRSYLTNSPKRDITIPSKGNDYGYLINNKGEKILEENPYSLFNKEKNNIGPGSYNIQINWKKNNALDWSKNSSRKNINKKEHDEMINKLDLLISQLNKIKVRDDLLNNNISTEPSNNNSQYISRISSSNYSNIISNSLPDENKKNNSLKLDKSNNTNEIIENINNENKNKINDIKYNESISSLNKNHYNYIQILDDEYHKEILNRYLESKQNNPGPGKYSLLSEFEKLAFSQKSKNFGSSSSRGLLYPAYKNKIKIGRQKFDKNLKIYSSYEKPKNNSIKDDSSKIIESNSDIHELISKNKGNKSSLNLRNFETKFKYITEKRENEEEEEEINDKNYNIEINNDEKEEDEGETKKINNINKKIENFGSLEKRFYEKPIKFITPGVGTYSFVKSIGNIENKYKSNSPYNKVIKNLKKNYQFSDDKKNIIYDINHRSPPIGLYSPESKNCIEYDCKKKLELNKGNKVAFFNNVEKFFKLNNQKDFSNDLGKYNIIKTEIEMKQQKAPFFCNEERNCKIKVLDNNSGNNNDKNLGPGSYRYDSYFDWIKKSFNKDFV